MPQIGDIYRCIAKGRLFGAVETRNMYTYRLESANTTDADIATALADAIQTGVYETIQDVLVNDFTIYSFEIQKRVVPAGEEPPYWTTIAEIPSTFTGAASTDIVSYQNAALLTLKTLGKRAIGRKFLPGLSEADTTDGQIAAARLSLFAQVVTNMLASVIPAGAGGLLYPGVLNKLGTFYRFTSGIVGNILSTMRRRKPGYGI